ncbi:hypothetical protein LTR66_006130 [Elasticomyces elasticus]|nr:hypothetical protein LTR66_006130 [Elasticomyces elasticus]
MFPPLPLARVVLPSSPKPRSSPSPSPIQLQQIVRAGLRSPAVTVRKIQISGVVPCRTYCLHISDGTSLTLKTISNCSTRLLRHERDSVAAEIEVLCLLQSRHKRRIISPKIVSIGEEQGSLCPFLLSTSLNGRTLADVNPSLSATQRGTVLISVGVYYRQLSTITSKAFGTAVQVSAGKGKQSWKDAFISLIIDMLCDAEDMLVSLPYDSIRNSVCDHGDVLDELVEPRLVIFNAADCENVLVDERTQQVTGLRHYSHAVWGDPLMIEIFENPPRAFLTGFGWRLEASVAARKRQLLYTIYRASIKVITNYARPENDGKELVARRQLSLALAQLAECR